MKLYSMQASNNCRRVNATVQHLGLDVEVVEQNMGDLKKPEYLAINPNGKVPALVDGDLKLWESRAIMQYLACRRSPARAVLAERDAKKQADITRWQFWESSHLSRAHGRASRSRTCSRKSSPNRGPIPWRSRRAKRDFHTFAPILNGAARRSQSSSPCRASLTLADFSVGACFQLRRGLPQLPWNNYSHIRAWWARLNEVPAWKNTAPKVG